MSSLFQKSEKICWAINLYHGASGELGNRRPANHMLYCRIRAASMPAIRLPRLSREPSEGFQPTE